MNYYYCRCFLVDHSGFLVYHTKFMEKTNKVVENVHILELVGVAFDQGIESLIWIHYNSVLYITSLYVWVSSSNYSKWLFILLVHGEISR